MATPSPMLLPADPLSADGLRQRHENRQILLQKLGRLRGELEQVQREVADLENTVRGLPYHLQEEHGGSNGRELPTRRFDFVSNAFAGGLALPIAMTAVHPVDTIRTTMQAALQGEQSFAKVARNLGLRGFTRGFGMSIIWASPQGALRLGTYEACKGEMVCAFDSRPLAVSISAIMGDLASSIVKVPRELITQRLQVGQHSSALGAVRAIVRDDGLAGLFRGYWSTCSRDAPFMVLLFFSYEQFKTWKIRLTFADRGPAQVLNPWSDAETVLWGGISGAIAGFMTTPFDVIKTRIMIAKTHLTMSDVFRQTPVSQLFAGAVPRGAWWFCVSSVFFATFERLRVIVQDTIDVDSSTNIATNESRRGKTSV